ncbi:ArfGap-domain-containing protein, partial [Aureobasidium melanogenum]
MSSTVSKRQQARNERMLHDLLKVPGNDRCADCAARNPAWSSWSLGIFLCMSCAALHRKMGTHISKVKSLSMDSWSPDQVDNMKRVGNVTSNRTFNPQNVKPDIPTDADEVGGVMERFIRQKYEHKAFVGPRPRSHTVGGASVSSNEGVPPPLPPKPGKKFGFSLGVRSSSATQQRFTPPLSPALTGSDGRSTPPIGKMNKPSRVFGSNRDGLPRHTPQLDGFEERQRKLGQGSRDASRAALTQTASSLRSRGHSQKRLLRQIPLMHWTCNLRAALLLNPLSRLQLRNLPSSPDLSFGHADFRPTASAAPAYQPQDTQQYQQPQQQSNPFLRKTQSQTFAPSNPFGIQLSAAPQNPWLAQPQVQAPQAQSPGAFYQPQQDFFSAQPQPPQQQSQYQQQPQQPQHQQKLYQQPPQQLASQQTSNPYANMPLQPASNPFQVPQSSQPEPYQSYQSAQQQMPQQQQQLFSQPTGRYGKTDIMALYNQPQLAPPRPLQPLPENGMAPPMMPQQQQQQQVQVPLHMQQGPQRSVTMPVGSGSMNPFGSGFSAPQQDQQARPDARHVSQESRDFVGMGNGRPHSPDAFASLVDSFKQAGPLDFLLSKRVTLSGCNVEFGSYFIPYVLIGLSIPSQALSDISFCFCYPIVVQYANNFSQVSGLPIPAISTSSALSSFNPPKKFSLSSSSLQYGGRPVYLLIHGSHPKARSNWLSIPRACRTLKAASPSEIHRRWSFSLYPVRSPQMSLWHHSRFCSWVESTRVNRPNPEAQSLRPTMDEQNVQSCLPSPREEPPLDEEFDERAVGVEHIPGLQGAYIRNVTSVGKRTQYFTVSRIRIQRLTVAAEGEILWAFVQAALLLLVEQAFDRILLQVLDQEDLRLVTLVTGSVQAQEDSFLAVGREDGRRTSTLEVLNCIFERLRRRILRKALKLDVVYVTLGTQRRIGLRVFGDKDDARLADVETVSPLRALTHLLNSNLPSLALALVEFSSREDRSPALVLTLKAGKDMLLTRQPDRLANAILLNQQCALIGLCVQASQLDGFSVGVERLSGVVPRATPLKKAEAVSNIKVRQLPIYAEVTGRPRIAPSSLGNHNQGCHCRELIKAFLGSMGRKWLGIKFGWSSRSLTLLCLGSYKIGESFATSPNHILDHLSDRCVLCPSSICIRGHLLLSSTLSPPKTQRLRLPPVSSLRASNGDLPTRQAYSVHPKLQISTFVSMTESVLTSKSSGARARARDVMGVGEGASEPRSMRIGLMSRSRPPSAARHLLAPHHRRHGLLLYRLLQHRLVPALLLIDHQPALRELCAIDEVRVYGILQVATTVVWKKDINNSATAVIGPATIDLEGGIAREAVEAVGELPHEIHHVRRHCRRRDAESQRHRLVRVGLVVCGHLRLSTAVSAQIRENQILHLLVPIYSISKSLLFVSIAVSEHLVQVLSVVCVIVEVVAVFLVAAQTDTIVAPNRLGSFPLHSIIRVFVSAFLVKLVRVRCFSTNSSFTLLSLQLLSSGLRLGVHNPPCSYACSQPNRDAEITDGLRFGIHLVSAVGNTSELATHEYIVKASAANRLSFSVSRVTSPPTESTSRQKFLQHCVVAWLPEPVCRLTLRGDLSVEPMLIVTPEPGRSSCSRSCLGRVKDEAMTSSSEPRFQRAGRKEECKTG